MARFIAAQRAEHQIPHATACRALGVSPAWFYKWRDGDASRRRARREQLTAEIRRLFAARRGRYGSPRITADLRDQGWRVLALLPSLRSMDEIACDLSVLINSDQQGEEPTFGRSTARSASANRRCAALTAHEHGLIPSSGSDNQSVEARLISRR